MMNHKPFSAFSIYFSIMYCNNYNNMLRDSYVIEAMAISKKKFIITIFIFLRKDIILILSNNKNINYNNIIRLMGCIALGCISK